MKKRIFAILILAITLTLSAFPVFADSYNPEDISFEKIETFSATTQTYSDVLIGKLTLNEGLYILDCNISFLWWGESGETCSASFFVKSSSSSGNSILLSCSISQGDYVFYIYVTAPISIYINAQSSLVYTVDIYSTKHYNDFLQEGYNSGFDSGYATGYEVGYGDCSSDSYNNGRAEGILIGREQGYNDGYNKGKEAGYILGEADGWEHAIKDSDEVKTAIGGIFTGVFDGAVDSFNELTEGITIMGLTLKQILLTIAALGIIGICIWLFALKK